MRFGARAKEYAENASIQKEVGRWTADWIEADVCGLDALEFGAGPGVFTRYLAGRGFRELVATDISRRMVEEGRFRESEATWRRMDAWNPDRVWVDRIYSCSLLQWAEDPLATLGRWRSCMRPGGRALVSLFVEGSMRELLEVSPELAAFSWRSDSCWIEIMEKAGWRVLRQEKLRRELCFGSGLEALKSLHAIGAVRENRFRPVELRRQLGAIDERYCARGNVPLSWVALKVELAV